MPPRELAAVAPRKAALREYGGPGAYGRKTTGHDARFAYNHINCAPMLLWLAEAAGVDTAMLRTAHRAVTDALSNGPAQCAAFRRLVPWNVVETALLAARAR